MLSTKYTGLSYPTHFLESRGSVIRNNFLENRTNKATHVAQRIALFELLVINKAKHILNRPLSCFISDTIYSKSMKKNRKKSHF